ncbi:hypothetical protein DDI_1985 [Dickeya dianthicola RNS04.9]|nr:hypothetical protein DDI_1985 [Dickeya dianthicola RNS04.9]
MTESCHFISVLLTCLYCQAMPHFNLINALQGAFTFNRTKSE